ncbi:MAG: thiamine diphosphokinase [Bacteroidota bacterium]|jgi:thiamine pyrophosphokinase|nr:thiamine diphosphokinase [Bacteroidota bacterium]
MSSHHIVKDNQEPALIIANGESCSMHLLNQLLEWSPVVMVLDGALPRVLDLGIKIDIVLGDFDRAHEPEKVLAHQYPIEIIHTPNQDKTDLEKGIDLLLSRNHTAINIVWATGKRADHTLNNLSTLAKYKDLANLVMYDDYSKIFCLPKSFDKWYTAATPISLMPISRVEGVVTSGLKYNLNNEFLDLGICTSSSNEALQDGTVKIAYQSGTLLLMECHD